MRFLSLVFLSFAGCGAMTVDHADGGAECNTTARTCDGAFGVYALEYNTDQGCTWNSGVTSVTIGLFDGGVASARWSNIPNMPMPLTRMGCQLVGPFSTASSDIEFTYEPSNDTLRGRVQLFTQNCAGGVQVFNVVGRKP